MQKDWTEDNPFVTILKIRDNAAAAATAAATSTAAVSVNVVQGELKIKQARPTHYDELLICTQAMTLWSKFIKRNIGCFLSFLLL